MEQWLPRYVHVLLPGTCDSVMLHWQKEIKVADVIRVTSQLTLKREIILDYLCGPNPITVLRESFLAVVFNDGGWGPRGIVCSLLKERDPSLEPPKAMQSC